MKDSWPIWTALIAGLTGFLMMQVAFGQIATYKSDGYLPPVIAVALSTPDAARICAEREQGLTDCRTVGELRKWLRERAGIEKFVK